MTGSTPKSGAFKQALFRRGKALLSLGDGDRAEKDLKKILEVGGIKPTGAEKQPSDQTTQMYSKRLSVSFNPMYRDSVLQDDAASSYFTYLKCDVDY